MMAVTASGSDSSLDRDWPRPGQPRIQPAAGRANNPRVALQVVAAARQPASLLAAAAAAAAAEQPEPDRALWLGRLSA
jgi:phage tail sheath gpL-like